jgi:cobalt-zinc-cadmium resistance protein CzcA
VLTALLRFSLGHRALVLLSVLGMTVAGAWAFRLLKLEAYPDISDPGVVVITQYPGFAAEEVEQQVTIPVERALNNTPNVIARRSRTIFGLSVVELTFADGTNDYFARQVVLEKLGGAALPDGVTPGLGPLSTGISEFYRYVLTGGGYDTMQLRELQDWVVVPRLLQVPGVADVANFGGLVRQYQIEVDPKALTKYRFSVRQIADAVKNNNRNAGGSLLRLGQQSLAIRGSGLIQNTEDIGSIVLDAQKGVPVFVRDIGRVTIGNLPQTGLFGLNRERIPGGGVEGIALMRRWENPSEVLGNIHRAVEDINATRLPQGVRIVPIHDRTELVQNTLHTVSRVLIEGFVIVITVLLIFFVNIRAAVLTALTIPLALLFAFVCMYLSGISLSLLSIGALDFGILVDGTIVMVERILRALEESAGGEHDPGETVEKVQTAAAAVQRPILFSLIIIIAAYIPLLTLERVERRLFTPMAMTVCFALLGSLILCLTFVPVLATYLFASQARHRPHRLLDWLTTRYEHGIRATVRRPGLTVVVAGFVVIGSLFLGSRLGTEFLPTLDEGVIWIRGNLPAGISMEKSAEVAARARELILESPEVKLVTSQTGRNDDGTDPFGPNRNEFLVDLRPYSTWKSGRTKPVLVDELSRRLRGEIPGMALNFTQPIIDTSTEIATGSSADLAVIISGPDRGRLRELAQRTLAVIRTIRGAADTSIEQEADQAQLRIAMNRFQIARYGINVSDVQDVIDLAIGGSPITGVFEGDRRFDVVARFVPEARSSPEAIGALLIPTKDGGVVPLSQLAEIRTAEGATIIARGENERQLTVRTNIRGRDHGGFVAEAQEKFARDVPLPPGYRVTWGGYFENFQRARERLLVVVPLTVAIIFVVLFITFGSTLDSLLVLLNVPFSMAGGIILLYLRGINLSVSAAVGFISLFGVAVMSGLLYIADINTRRSTPGLSLAEAVIQGARVQFRPRLVLIVVAVLGMLPAALAHGIGSDIQRPLATVVVGGLIATLVLTLLVLPAVYLLADRLRKPRGEPAAGTASRGGSSSLFRP